MFTCVATQGGLNDHYWKEMKKKFAEVDILGIVNKKS